MAGCSVSQACPAAPCTCRVPICDPHGCAGILIFMALVDLIAVDFMEAKRPLRSKVTRFSATLALHADAPSCLSKRRAHMHRARQALGYVLLLLGSVCMGIVAIWA